VIRDRKQTHGTAFLKWFRHVARKGFDQYERIWYYGMVMLGDSTLILDWGSNHGYE